MVNKNKVKNEWTDISAITLNINKLNFTVKREMYFDGIKIS